MTPNVKSIYRVLRKPKSLINHYFTVHNDAILLPKDNTFRNQTSRNDKRREPKRSTALSDSLNYPAGSLR